MPVTNLMVNHPVVSSSQDISLQTTNVDFIGHAKSQVTKSEGFIFCG